MTATLLPCPIVNQRTEPGNDGRPPEDGNMDCVPASLASMARALRPALHITADGLHDAAYGQGYIGLMDPARFVHLLAGYGLNLVPRTGTPKALYFRANVEILGGHPVLLSIPSDWNNNPPTSKYAHMVAGRGVSDSQGAWLEMMNPWTAQYERHDAGWWYSRLGACGYKCAWVMEATGMPIPTGWTDDGMTLTAPNGVKVVRGFRDHILAAAAWSSALVPMAPEYGIANGSRQDFAMRLEWTAATNVQEVPQPFPPPDAPDPVAEAKAKALDSVFALYKEIGS